MASEISKHQVTHKADAIARDAMDRLSAGERSLHNYGYHQWSTAYSNMRYKIEKALIEFFEEIEG